MKVKNSKSGMVLISVIMVIVVVMLYLSSHTFLALYDSKNLQKEKKIQSALFLAKSGLERAAIDLHLDDDSWLDGEINGNAVTGPNVNNPDTFFVLYNNEPLDDGYYTVEVDYLQKDPEGGGPLWEFYDKRIFLRSTGTASDGTQKVLEAVEFYGVIKNLTQDKMYYSLQEAIDAAVDNDKIGIARAKINENITINPAGNTRYYIWGGYDSSFSFRSVSDYPTIIDGDINIGVNADVELSGITLE